MDEFIEMMSLLGHMIKKRGKNSPVTLEDLRVLFAHVIDDDYDGPETGDGPDMW